MIMAGTSLDNINTAPYSQLIEKIFDFVEKSYFKNSDEEKKLLSIMRKHLDMGGEAAYNSVPKEFAGEIREMLINQKIPFAVLPNATGDVMFIVRAQDGQRFLEMQQDVMTASTQYAKELTANAMIKQYERSGQGKAEMLTITDKDMAFVAKQKLEKSGITFASVENPDGSTSFVVSPHARFNRSGNDLVNFELLHAFEQSKADESIASKSEIFDVRVKQAQFDDDRLTEFAKGIQTGGRYVFAPAYGKCNCYIETKGGEVSLFERKLIDGAETWVENPLKIDPSASLKDIKIALSYPTRNISFADCISANRFDRNNNCSSREEAESIDFGRKVRPIVKKGTPSYNYDYVAQYEIKPMIDAINETATKLTNNTPGIEMKTQEELYDIKKQHIQEIIEAKQHPQIQEFLNSERYLSKEEKEQWFNKITEHFTNTNERGDKYACIVEKPRLNVLKKLIGAMQKEDTKQEEKEQEV